MGLREDKKESLRADCRCAALTLIAEQGFEATTIDQIACAAKTSQRTFIRYFPSKEDVVVSWVEELMNAMVTDFEAQPPSTTPWRELQQVVRATLVRYQEQRDFFLTLERVILDSPTLLARKIERLEDVTRALIKLVAKRMGASAKDAAPDLFVRTLMSVMGSTIVTWANTKGKGSLPELFDNNMQLLGSTLWR